MSRLLIPVFVLISVLAITVNGSLAQQPVKKGASVTLDVFKGAKAIKRVVPSGQQIFHLEGANIGSFTDKNGKKIESSNYEVKNGVLFIKSFGEQDVGSYTEEPVNTIKSGKGSVLGPTLELFIEQ